MGGYIGKIWGPQSHRELTSSASYQSVKLLRHQLLVPVFGHSLYGKARKVRLERRGLSERHLSDNPNNWHSSRVNLAYFEWTFSLVVVVVARGT